MQAWALMWMFVVLSYCTFNPVSARTFDLTVVGSINHADGIGRQSIGLIDLLKDDLEINFISTSNSKKNINTRDVDKKLQAILFNDDETPGTVSILEDPLWYVRRPIYQKVPPSRIKIAYSMLESSEIPPEWTQILNENFDAVVVPDLFLVEVYKNCGVTIPIFELPLGIYIDDFLKSPRKLQSNKPFIFGNTVSCDPRKNHALLLKAFAEEFGNSKDVVLKLNSRNPISKDHQKLLKTLNASNIFWTSKTLNHAEYVEFFKTLDCYVNISKGEGFSICPREAFALEIPCILSNNSAQITLCNTGIARAVPSEIKEPAIYQYLFGPQTVGFYSNCAIDEVRLALRDVYENYQIYLQKAQNGSKWVKQYRWKNLKMKYLNLIKPKLVKLGDRNEITDNYFMTNSIQLYEKYRECFGESN